MVLKENTKYLLRNPIKTSRVDAIEAFFNLVNHQFEQIKSYDELTSEERKLITRGQFEYLFE